jgi:hypothetical protein
LCITRFVFRHRAQARLIFGFPLKIFCNSGSMIVRMFRV